MIKFALITIIVSFDGGWSASLDLHDSLAECLGAERKVEIPYDDSQLEHHFSDCVRFEFIQLHEAIAGLRI